MGEEFKGSSSQHKINWRTKKEYRRLLFAEDEDSKRSWRKEERNIVENGKEKE